MINETMTHFVNELTTNVVSSAYSPNGLSWFQIILITIGLLSLMQSVVFSAFKYGIEGVFYIIGIMKWIYYKSRGKDI